MEAPRIRTVLVAAILLVSMGARQRSANFIVETSDPKLAAQIAEAAEKYRHDLAIDWIGHTLPNWSQPCPMTVQVGPNLGAGGATSFVFDQGEVFGWRMTIQGSAERIFDSVLPHEITHMVFASHFRRPLPRWADEGGATSVEHISERTKHRQMLVQFLHTGRGIAFNKMFAMKEYPADVMPLYAQGYSVAEFLIETGGRRKYVEFVGDGLNSNDWSGAVQRHYGVVDLGELQTTWLAWVAQGSPQLKPRQDHPAAAPAGEMLAAATTGNGLAAAATRRERPQPNLLYHVRDRQRGEELLGSTPQKVTPLGPLVPVSQPADMTLASHEPVAPRQGAAAPPQSPPVVLPATGWRAPGDPAPRVPVASIATATPTDPFRTQVTRPQPIEQPKQTILEWSRD